MGESARSVYAGRRQAALLVAIAATIRPSGIGADAISDIRCEANLSTQSMI
jgi:hypothetical protein